MDTMRFLDRLKELVNWEETNALEISRMAGVGYDTVREITRGRTKSISVDNAKRILDAFGLTFADIYGEDSGSGFAEKRADIFGIPRYKASLSAGHGAVDIHDGGIVDYIPFTPEFFFKKLGLKSVKGLLVCDIKGDSMEPTLGDGDLAMVTTNFDSEKSGLYAVNYGEDTYVKRLARLADGYRLISDNPLYPAIDVEGSDLEKFRIIGEVIWLGRTV